MNGNIALSMEIGSAYALQVLLLQIPALVFYSAFHTRVIDQAQVLAHSFSKTLSDAATRLLPKHNADHSYSAHLPTMGHGHRNSLRLPPFVHVRRRQEQLLQRLHTYLIVLCGGCRVLPERV